MLKKSIEASVHLSDTNDTRTSILKTIIMPNFVF